VIFLNAARGCNRKSTKIFVRREILLTQLVGIVSKCTKDSENLFAPLMVSIGGWKMTLAGKTVYQNGSIDTSFDPPSFSLDSAFKYVKTTFAPISFLFSR
jgi:hypothetical protein